jgi:hypothetical protein
MTPEAMKRTFLIFISDSKFVRIFQILEQIFFFAHIIFVREGLK